MAETDNVPLTSRLKTSPYLLRTPQSRASAVAVVCSLASAMLVLGQPSPRSNVTASEGQAQTPDQRAAATAASTTDLQDPSTITITGCLEQDDDRFRLKDTAGVNAPRSRSWKSGFLKRGAATIEIMVAADGVQLTNHVGRRVRVTGTLADGEMRVRSLRRVAASCEERPEA